MLANHIVLESRYNNEKRIRILEGLGDSLPHGSGINDDWSLKLTSPTRVHCTTGYHCMDEMGGYDGWAYFTVILDLVDPEVFRIMFHGRESQYNARKYDLRSYLTDTICEELVYTYGEGPIKC